MALNFLVSKLTVFALVIEILPSSPPVIIAPVRCTSLLLWMSMVPLGFDTPIRPCCTSTSWLANLWVAASTLISLLARNITLSLPWIAPVFRIESVAPIATVFALNRPVLSTVFACTTIESAIILPLFLNVLSVLAIMDLPLTTAPIASIWLADCLAKYTLGYKTCWGCPFTTIVFVSSHTISVVIVFICSSDKVIPGVNLYFLPYEIPASSNALYSLSLSV